MKEAKDSVPYNLSDIPADDLSNIPADFSNAPSELSGPQKAQIKMTYCVLSGAVIILSLSGAAFIWSDNGVSQYVTEISNLCTADKTESITDFCNKYIGQTLSTENTAAKEVFDFCKSFIPPIVTLVLGAHYVTRNLDSNN